MNCNNCGREIYIDTKPCKYCGHINKAVTTTQINYYPGSRPMPKAPDCTNLLVCSILMLVFLIILPIVNATLFGASAFPNRQSVYFTDIVFRILPELSEPFSEPMILLAIIPFVAGILLLIGSCIKSKVFCIVSSAAGSLGMLAILGNLANDALSPELIFSLTDTYIGIGTWALLIVLIISLIISICKQ